MAILYLLDTNTVSDLIRHPQGRVAGSIEDVGEENVVTSVIVACEIRYGAAKKGSRRLTKQVEAVLGALTVRPVESDVERAYVSIRVALEKKGTPIWRARHADRGACPSARRGVRYRQRRRVQTRFGTQGGELVAVARARSRKGVRANSSAPDKGHRRQQQRHHDRGHEIARADTKQETSTSIANRAGVRSPRFGGPDRLYAHVGVLKIFGPQMGRPCVETLTGSTHANMKELRFDSADGVRRFAFAFDPARKVIILCGGDKSGGSQRRFYRQLIDKADECFDAHLAVVLAEAKKNRAKKKERKP